VAKFADSEAAAFIRLPYTVTWPSTTTATNRLVSTSLMPSSCELSPLAWFLRVPVRSRYTAFPAAVYCLPRKENEGRSQTVRTRASHLDPLS
jgi:hypothetical protein